MNPGSPRRDHELYELLDAYLDDELTADERSSVDELLHRSADARVELGDIERVRSMVRGLPPVDPPFGFYERLARPTRSSSANGARRQRAPGLVFASVGAVAAAILLFVAVTPTFDRFTPPIDEMNDRHLALVSNTTDRYESAMPEDLVTGSLNARTESGDFRRVDMMTTDDDVQMVYSDGQSAISVFEHSGRVDWNDLPAGGSRMAIDDDPAWTMAMPTTDVVVVEREGMVVTVIGTAPHDQVMATAEAVPDPPPPSVADRVGDVCSWIAEGFGFPR